MPRRPSRSRKGSLNAALGIDALLRWEVINVVEVGSAAMAGIQERRRSGRRRRPCAGAR